MFGASTGSQPTTEVDLLDDAQDALRGDAGRALALADEHARRFRFGALAQEREVIAIEALVRLQRNADARARAAEFFRDFPHTAHRPRIQALLSAGVAPSAHNP
jgi:hypothetical protein